MKKKAKNELTESKQKSQENVISSAENHDKSNNTFERQQKPVSHSKRQHHCSSGENAIESLPTGNIQRPNPVIQLTHKIKTPRSQLLNSLVLQNKRSTESTTSNRSHRKKNQHYLRSAGPKSKVADQFGLGKLKDLHSPHETNKKQAPIVLLNPLSQAPIISPLLKTTKKMNSPCSTVCSINLNYKRMNGDAYGSPTEAPRLDEPPRFGDYQYDKLILENSQSPLRPDPKRKYTCKSDEICMNPYNSDKIHHTQKPSGFEKAKPSFARECAADRANSNQIVRDPHVFQHLDTSNDKIKIRVAKDKTFSETPLSKLLEKRAFQEDGSRKSSGYTAIDKLSRPHTDICNNCRRFVCECNCTGVSTRKHKGISDEHGSAKKDQDGQRIGDHQKNKREKLYDLLTECLENLCDKEIDEDCVAREHSPDTVETTPEIQNCPLEEQWRSKQRTHEYDSHIRQRRRKQHLVDYSKYHLPSQEMYCSSSCESDFSEESNINCSDVCDSDMSYRETKQRNGSVLSLPNNNYYPVSSCYETTSNHPKSKKRKEIWPNVNESWATLPNQKRKSKRTMNYSYQEGVPRQCEGTRIPDSKGARRTLKNRSSSCCTHSITNLNCCPESNQRHGMRQTNQDPCEHYMYGNEQSLFMRFVINTIWWIVVSVMLCIAFTGIIVYTNMNWLAVYAVVWSVIFLGCLVFLNPVKTFVLGTSSTVCCRPSHERRARPREVENPRHSPGHSRQSQQARQDRQARHILCSKYK